MTDPIEYADKTDEDTMHFNQDMQKPDKAEFFQVHHKRSPLPLIQETLEYDTQGRLLLRWNHTGISVGRESQERHQDPMRLQVESEAKRPR